MSRGMFTPRGSLIPIVSAVVLPILAACSALGGPHSNPEAVVRAYLDAIVEGRCQDARGLVHPAQQDAVAFECGPDAYNPITSSAIDDIIVEEDTTLFPNPSMRKVTVLGQIGTQKFGSFSQEIYWVEVIEGKWYVVPLP